MIVYRLLSISSRRETRSSIGSEEIVAAAADAADAVGVLLSPMRSTGRLVLLIGVAGEWVVFDVGIRTALGLYPGATLCSASFLQRLSFLAE